MDFRATRFGDLSTAIAAACDRFVHPSVSGDAERTRRRRVVGMMLFAPILLAAATTLLFAGNVGVSATLAITLGLFALCWTGVLVAASIRIPGWLEPTALLAGIPAVVAVILASGGLASPASLLLVAAPLEAYWVYRTRKALLVGAGVVAAAIVLTLSVAWMWPAAVGEPSAWQWLLPLTYAATLCARLAAENATWPHRSEENQSTLTADMINGVVLRLAPGGEVIDASEKAQSMLNLAPQLLRGGGLFERVHVADRVQYLCALSQLREGVAPARLDIRLRLPNAPGESGPDNFQPFTMEFCSDARRTDFTAILYDNGELARLRAALRQATDKTEELDTAKGRFLAAVSHELRTPLNAIIGFSDMLLHEMFGGFTDPRQREYTELIKESGHHLLAVVNAILDVSKIESGTYPIQAEPFAFAEAAEMCRSMMSLQAERKAIDLRMEIGASVGEVVADRRAVQQILINLLANSVKFTPEGGLVALGARRLGSRLHFWVADNGIGMTEEDLERIGRPFTQVRNDYTRQFEGTGLGLSLVKGLVALHDGTMSIESAPGEGTKVAISLPIDGPTKANDGTEKNTEALPLREVDHGTLRKTA